MSYATRIVDVPCGDMNWMGTLLPLLKEAGVKYLGMDVVGDVGERFAGLNNRMRMRRKGEMNLTYFLPCRPLSCLHSSKEPGKIRRRRGCGIQAT